MTSFMLDIPFFFSLAARFRNLQSGRHLWVTPDTDVVVEGYPRSANTFLYRIIRAAADDSFKIGHHVHRPQQVTMALRYGVPCFVLFRHPLDAIASFLVREPGLTARSCLVDYLRFAETTLAQVDYAGLFILVFDEVVADPKGLTQAILTKIGQPAEVSDTLIAAATLDERDDHRRSSLPNPEKEALKRHHIAVIEALPDYATAVELFDFATEHAWQR